jgi:hypothetical protein
MELFAVCIAVCKAVTLEDCQHIIIFTNPMVAAKRAVDPSVHSGQAHSLATCKALAQWFTMSENHRVEFITTPSKIEWGLQYAAHCRARSLPAIPMGRRPATSLDSMRKCVTDSVLDSWSTMFQDKKYRGHQFLSLVETKGTVIAPTYANGGLWLKFVGEDVKTCTRMCRAILDHTPTSDYYRRFNIPKLTPACVVPQGNHASTYSQDAQTWTRTDAHPSFQTSSSGTFRRTQPCLDSNPHQRVSGEQEGQAITHLMSQWLLPFVGALDLAAEKDLAKSEAP